MELINFVLHFERYIPIVIDHFGNLIYALLFFIVFAETGFVVTPFLPGDSLLFVVGTVAGGGFLNIWLVYILLLAAAILGNMLNYYLGSKIGHKVFANKDSKFFSHKNLVKTHEFFEKYGGKTIILTRFIPIIRSFAPFVAGMGAMSYKTFMIYNVVGGFLWVTSLLFAGYFFGGLPIVKKNFEVAVYIVIFISLIPAIVEYIRHKMKKSKTADHKK
jgi:membrane-associated protein